MKGEEGVKNPVNVVYGFPPAPSVYIVKDKLKLIIVEVLLQQHKGDFN